jgi:Tol biopolymer transport system component
VDGGSPRRLTNNDVPETQPDVARDGTMVYWRGGDIWTMTSNGENQARLSSVPAELGFTPRWSPDKKRLALLRYDPSDRAYVIQQGRTQGFPILDVVVVSLATGRVTDVGAQVASDVNGVSWTPDGRGLLVNQYEPSQ